MASRRLPAVLLLGTMVAAVMLAAIGAPPPQPRSSCQRKCGSVDIPYPFGIQQGSDDHCAMPDFYLTCNDTGSGVYKPFYSDIEVLNISLQNGKAKMLNSISSACYNNKTGVMDYDDWYLNFTNSPYSLSGTINKFTVIGCQVLAYIQDDISPNTGHYMSGCVANCERGNMTTLKNGSCSGIGCCQTAIPNGLEYYHVLFDEDFNTTGIYNVSPCNFAVLMDSSDFTFLATYVTSLDFNKTNDGQAPLVVDWAIGNKNCDAARKEHSTYACVSSNSECFDSPGGKGYICNCSKGFEGNPYLQDPKFGCKDIDEFRSNPCPINGKCRNTRGGFKCLCPAKYPKGIPINGTCKQDQALSFKAKLFIGLSVSVLTCLILFLGKELIKHKRHIARQEHKRKIDECFERNRGQLLKVQCNISFKLYGREEVELATNNFDDNAIIGEGGQGTVYIGHNLDPDNNPVAIKRCKGFDESRRMDFGKELLILSRVNHENIVKLLGCSLQFDVLVLVYEYVPNRTQHYLIHSHDNKDIRTLDIGLKIATKSAEALAYLHALNHPILHGDVKVCQYFS